MAANEREIPDQAERSAACRERLGARLEGPQGLRTLCAYIFPLLSDDESVLNILRVRAVDQITIAMDMIASKITSAVEM
eukprot:3222140-Rhodomonas_salina.1